MGVLELIMQVGDINTKMSLCRHDVDINADGQFTLRSYLV